MTAGRHLGVAAAALLALALAGCALPTQVSETPAGPDLTGRKAKAAALTRQGELAAALVEWRVLETLARGDAGVARERRALEAEIARRTAADFAAGRTAAAKGRLKQARRSFLAVLKLDPNHGAAIEELRKIEVVRVRQRRPHYRGYEAARAAAAKPAQSPKPSAAQENASDLKEAAALAEEAYEKGVRVFRQDVNKAIAYWEQALAYDPAHAKAKLHLERAYRIQATLKSIKP